MAIDEGAVEQAISNLKELLAALNEATMQMETACGVIEEAEDARATLVEAVRNEWQELAGAAKDVATEVEGQVGAVTEVMEQAVNSLQTALGEVQEHIGSMDDAEEAFEQALEQVRAQLDAGISEFQEAEDLITEGMNTVLGRIDTTQNEMEQAFTAIAGSLGELHGKFTSLHTEAVEDFQETATEIGEAVLGSVEAAFDDISGQVQDDFLPSMVDNLTDLGSSLQDLFGNLGQVGEQLADGLKDMAGNIITDLATNVKDDVCQQLEDAFQQMINEAVAAMVGEIAENIIIMNIGTATTTALAPYVPALAVAEKVLAAFNAVLEAFGL